MKKLILCTVLALTLGLNAVYAQDYAFDTEVEYVFSEEELRSFLQVQIQAAVDTITASLLKDEAIHIALKDHQIEVRDLVIADYEKQLKAFPRKLLIASASAGTVALAIGLLVGIFAF